MNVHGAAVLTDVIARVSGPNRITATLGVFRFFFRGQEHLRGVDAGGT